MITISRKPTTNCPKCESASVYRSKRRGVAETFLHRVLFISPYRCYDCDNRHYRFRLSRAHVVAGLQTGAFSRRPSRPL